jgi:hypothetical protein
MRPHRGSDRDHDQTTNARFSPDYSWSYMCSAGSTQVSASDDHHSRAMIAQVQYGTQGTIVGESITKLGNGGR